MDYEAIDRDMSSWLVGTVKNGVRLYLTDEGMATDILPRARRWRWIDQAEIAASNAMREPAWRGFNWLPVSVPAAIVAQAKE